MARPSKAVSLGVQMQAARAAALDWVTRHAGPQPWFLGAYIGGSAAALAEGAALPPDSDLDVFVVSAEPQPAWPPGKFVHGGALLEVTVLPWHALADTEALLSHYHLAAGVWAGRILVDPEGALRRTQAAVVARFAEAPWVRRRCGHALGVSAERLEPSGRERPWHEQVTAWLFGTGVTTHVLLVAALRNPTVRLRYLRARAVLEEYGRPDLHEELLGLLGCAGFSPRRVEDHLAALAATFDAAAAAGRSPYRFASDISPVARPIAIDGSRALIARGDHREAVFWIVATFARCHAVLLADAPETARVLAPHFDRLLSDLGITSAADLRARAETTRRFLPRVQEAAEAIIRANPAVLPAGGGGGQDATTPGGTAGACPGPGHPGRGPAGPPPPAGIP